MKDTTEQLIAATGANVAPRVTPADIEAQIASEHYFTADDGEWGAGRHQNKPRHPQLSLLTFCVLVLRNGFTVTGESACASPENFNAEVGRHVARKHAVEKIWPLLGYALRNELTGQRPMQTTAPRVLFDPATQEATPINGLLPHQQRVVEEFDQLQERLTKLQQFIEHMDDGEVAISGHERQRLIAQEIAMSNYADILAKRIDAFTAA